jgi:hypothetical protein
MKRKALRPAFSITGSLSFSWSESGAESLPSHAAFCMAGKYIFSARLKAAREVDLSSLFFLLTKTDL